MKLSYNLPKELIAQVPVEKRDEARLLVLSRKTGDIRHAVFKDIINLLNERHFLVLNNTRVFPGRLFGRDGSGGKVEVLLIRERAPLIWETLGKPSRRLKKGGIINFDHGDFNAEVLEDGNKKLLRFTPTPKTWVWGLTDFFFKYGFTPLPPYIKRPSQNVVRASAMSAGYAESCALTEESDRRRYQTVYAKKLGSCACPTAGLHFTPELLDALKKKGVGIAEITLHIGPGTFRPIKNDNPEEHIMEEEFFSICEDTASSINSARKRGKTVVAVGTSTVRALEQASAYGWVSPGEGNASIFIHPGYQFKMVDSLITNLHQPMSTPLAMVTAFAGEELIRKAYEEAVNEKYRFLSYGDSMLIF